MCGDGAGPSGRRRAPCVGSVEITITPGSGTAFLTAAGISEEQIRATLQSELNKLFQVSNAAGFVKGFGDAQSFTSKGLGVDYASEATRIELGASGSFALGMDKTYQPKDSTTKFPIQGVGMNASIMGGLGLGLFHSSLDPLMLFANWMRVPEQKFGDLKGSLQNYGFHGQLRLLGPKRRGSLLKMLVRWGGVAITTGWDYSRLNLAMDKALTSRIPVNQLRGANVEVKGDVAARARFDVDLSTWSVPLELTTSLRVLYLLTVYGGVGFDWQFAGASEMDVDITGSMVGTVAGDSTRYDLGSARIRASASASPSAGKFRGIAGAQLNMSIVRLFVQVTGVNTKPALASVAMGLRLAF